MSVVVTGASGHVGGNLVRSLLNEGRKVRALVRSDLRAVKGIDVEIINGDVLDYGSLLDVFNGADVVYHLAAKIFIHGKDIEEVQAVNVLGTRNVVRACLECKVKRLIHFSSIHAMYSYPVEEEVNENRPLSLDDRCFPYEKTKALGELEVMDGVKKGLDAVIINPAAIIGPFDFKPSHMGEVILKLFKNSFPALVEGGYNWVDVRDIVKGAMSAEKNGKTGEKYILSGEWLSLKQLAEIVSSYSQKGMPKIVTPFWLAHLGAPLVSFYTNLTGKRPLYTTESLKILQTHRYVSHEKATNELNYHPTPVKKTIEDTIEWFKNNHFIESDKDANL